MLLRCHLNQVVTNCRDVLFLPRDNDVQFDADFWVVLLLPREYVVGGRDGYVEVDLRPFLPAAIDLIVILLNHGRAFAKVATLCLMC